MSEAIKKIFKINDATPQTFLTPDRQSPEIFDDFSVKKNIATREGTVEKTPVNDSDIVNKAYVDSKKAEPRWIRPYACIGFIPTTAFPVVGRVYMQEFEVTESVIIDGILIHNYAVVAGNVTVGIYRLVTEESSTNADLVVECASTALAGTNIAQLIPLAQTQLTPARYYAAVEYSDVTHTYGKFNNGCMVREWIMYYDRAGGYGALTNPCPAGASGSSTIPTMLVRCVV